MLSPLGDAAAQAARWQRAYETGNKALDLARQLAAGATLESIAAGIVIDLVMDKATGAFGDKALTKIGTIMKRMKPYMKNAGKKITTKSGYEVEYDRLGFPKFDQWVKARVTIKMTGNRNVDIKLAEAAYKKPTPPGYTWHHSQDLTTMELVPFELNDEAKHMGGHAIMRILLGDD
ncbi:MAG: HNH endonuclease [Phycisphaeraceae bacterium]|nr:HNH endonuclease [Phycisphaeraceae bacterium]